MDYPRKKSFAAELLEKRQKKSHTTKILVIAIIIAVVAIGYALYMRFGVKEIPTETVEEIRSIAVLPFRDMSPEKDQDHLCEGLAEDIIHALNNVKELDVLARTSSFAFKDKVMDIREIGRKLEVDAVFEGSVSKYGNSLRITAQLINVADGFHIISEQYDKEMEDLFDIREEISFEIVEALKIELLGEEKAAIEKRYTNNIEAFTLYSQGRSYWSTRTEKGFEMALRYYNLAINEDPNYALAYAGIADVYSLIPGYTSLMSREEAFEKAKAYAEKAIKIDNTISEAYSALAWINLRFDNNLSTAENNLKLAVKYNSNNQYARHRYHDYYLILGQYEESLEQIKLALEIDPLSGPFFYNTVQNYILLDRYDEAKKLINKMTTLFPESLFPESIGIVNHLIGSIYYHQGNYEEAIEMFEKTIENKSYLLIDSVYRALGYAYAVTGENEKAEQIINELSKSGNLIGRAKIYLGLGENDKMFELLEKRRGNYSLSNLSSFKHDSEWEPIRSDPRFQALMKKMGLPED